MRAQTTAQKPDVKTCVVAGKVTNGNGGEPVRKARVMLLPREGEGAAGGSRDDFSAITDQNGAFTIEKVPAGKYVVMAEKPGFSPGRGASRQARRDLTLAAGQEMRDVLLTMIPAAAITGRVLDQDGEPMPHAQVMAMRYSYSGRGRRRLQPRASEQTDDRGEYRIFDLAPGQYYVAVQPGLTAEEPTNETTAEKRPARLRYPVTYYPGTLDEGDAAAVTLHGGGEARVDFSLLAMRTVNVSGRVIGAPANARVVVHLAARNNSYGASEPVLLKPGDTNFEMKSVLPGTYTVRATAFPMEGLSGVVGSAGGMEGRRSASRKITVTGADLTGVTLTLVSQSEHEIHGRLVAEGLAPEKLNGLGVRLMAANWRDLDDEEDISSTFGGGDSQLKRDGGFTIKSAGSGKVVPMVYANAAGFEDYYTKSASLGGRDVMDGFNITEAEGATLEVVIGNDGAHVEGFVVRDDKSPQPDATVVLVPDDATLRSHLDLYATTRTDQQGQFDMRGVRPGSYKLYAFEDLGDDEGAYYYDDFLGEYGDSALAIKIEAKQHPVFTLKPIRTKEQSE